MVLLKSLRDLHSMLDSVRGRSISVVAFAAVVVGVDGSAAVG